MPGRGGQPVARRHPALLVLRDGRSFRGEALGARGEAWGEVVFNTAMSGYQEILTDASYRGQIVDLDSGRVEITSQNHGFAVDPGSLGPGWEVTHLNLNDGTCEGLRNRDARAMSVQYHPEASPGPHDSAYLFSRFVSLMAEPG